ncbi:unnamed protein product, partial [Brassica oleracea]
WDQRIQKTIITQTKVLVAVKETPHTQTQPFFRNLDLQYFVEEPLTMLNRITTSRGYFNTSSTANLSKDSTIFVNLQMKTLTTVHIFMVY